MRKKIIIFISFFVITFFLINAKNIFAACISPVDKGYKQCSEMDRYTIDSWYTSQQADLERRGMTFSGEAVTLQNEYQLKLNWCEEDNSNYTQALTDYEKCLEQEATKKLAEEQKQLCNFYDWLCGNWSTCSSSGMQSRVCNKNSTCEGGVQSPDTSQSCNYIPTCSTDTWQCYDWSTCSQQGIQTRSCSKTFDCSSTETASPTTSQYCEAPNNQVEQTPTEYCKNSFGNNVYGIKGENSSICYCNDGYAWNQNQTACVLNIPTCSSFTYSDWSVCNSNGAQSRMVLSSYPINCTGGNQIINQSCQLEIKNNDIIITENNKVDDNNKINLDAANETLDKKIIVSNSTETNIKMKTIAEEKSLIIKIDKKLSKRVSGNILLQVEKNGEGWYVYPNDQKKYYLGRPADAFSIMRNLGLGIKHSELENYLNSTFPSRLSGKILLDVEQNGEAYYINPNDLKGHYLNRPSDAFKVMRELGLGITNSDIRKIDVGEVE